MCNDDPRLKLDACICVGGVTFLVGVLLGVASCAVAGCG